MRYARIKPAGINTFMHVYNRTRPTRRRGHLWADRFKNTILENGLAEMRLAGANARLQAFFAPS